LGVANCNFVALNHHVVKWSYKKDLSLVIGHELCHAYLAILNWRRVELAKSNIVIAKKGVKNIHHLYLAQGLMKLAKRFHRESSHGASFKAAMKVLGLKADAALDWLPKATSHII
jgi:hypothetical protein